MTMWEPTFLAVSIALGESLDDAVGALGERAAACGSLPERLRTESREMRARAIAEQLAPIAVDLEQLEIAWPG